MTLCPLSEPTQLVRWRRPWLLECSVIRCLILICLLSPCVSFGFYGFVCPMGGVGPYLCWLLGRPFGDIFCISDFLLSSSWPLCNNVSSWRVLMMVGDSRCLYLKVRQNSIVNMLRNSPSNHASATWGIFLIQSLLRVSGFPIVVQIIQCWHLINKLAIVRSINQNVPESSTKQHCSNM